MSSAAHTPTGQNTGEAAASRRQLLLVSEVWADTRGPILQNRQRTSHRSVSSQPRSIAGDETVLFILMVAALQQTDEEENRDGNSQREAVITTDTAEFSLFRAVNGGLEARVA